MKRVSPLMIASLLVFTQACDRANPPTVSTSNALQPPCMVALAANPGTDTDIARLQRDLREKRAPGRAAEQLGYRFIAQARLTNDAGFYKVAEQTAACLDSIEPNGAAALLLRGHAFHQMHRFAEAEQIARQLVASREFVLDFGLLGDVLMEQGRVTEASVAYQKMIDLKPFYQSYTRAAHLRWLRGDVDGAIEMMHAAIRSASPRDRESVAWAYSRLAVYELQRGRLSEAARMTDRSLEYVSDYAAALLARGRIQLAQTQFTAAAATLEKAARLNPLPEYRWAFADALRALQRIDDAVAVERQLVDQGADDPRTFALYLSTRREDGSKALDLARRELEKRADIFTLDALAWALAAAGQLDDASALMDRALAEGTQDARLFLHAAVIAAATGRSADAARWHRAASKLRYMLLPSELGVLRGGVVTTPRI